MPKQAKILYNNNNNSIASYLTIGRRLVVERRRVRKETIAGVGC